MTALSIRQIPIQVEKAIREKATRDHVSLNKAVVAMLEEAVIGKRKPQPKHYHDLDWMCGIWNKKQSDEFRKNLEKDRTVDPELWQ